MTPRDKVYRVVESCNSPKQLQPTIEYMVLALNQKVINHSDFMELGGILQGIGIGRDWFN